ncbi:hypothetical protein ADK78_17865 [Kitasatospora aureofaciens]|uniref:Uncharacterized protein n=2 Tax=Streptomyces rimosus TaxID=1927 RepID=A0A8A1V423_STRR1|nr:hypothetical protein DF17_21885 [Streptomyces rimosus]KOG73160.1 hypothetical protein ADK78_17865 [Kitasatospora aureofaciens]KUJ35221.1 hypothetical protein ADK46_17205 [Streptomyces rimosus subsp. rimosus]MYT42018.1 hypothetical protein [Streptomyces sp. SID5471]QGY71958.1 hypothetical protein V519_038555 [Streptomyces rimosus R6-500]QST86778.1 hypothetical protein SRIM_041255 [Streptomyces rimosus subsp. rimosus ATCC 10970]
MSLARRTLMEAAAARFGWQRAYGETTAVDALLTEQTDTAYAQAADHAALATAKNDNALAVQPGVLDARGRVLADVLYLEGVLAGARNRRLAPELIARLEDAVGLGHELTVLLADTVRTTAVHTASGT